MSFPAGTTVPRILYLAILAATGSAHASSLALEEVVVTAQKRESSTLDVPMTVNAVTGKSMTDYKILDFKDLAVMTPGLTLNNISGQKSAISLRGISFDPDSNAASAVDVYWNDVRVHPVVAFQEMFDLSRVEVLRGPQGSLQGRTSPAGAIMLVTKMPDTADESVSGNFSQTFSEGGASNTQLAVSVPLIPDQLAVRAAMVYDENSLSGIRNAQTGTSQTNRSRGGRFSVSWDPLENLRVSLSSEYLEKFGRYPLALSGYRTDAGEFVTVERRSNTVQDSATQNRKSISFFKLEYDLAEHTITSLTGYVDRRTDDNFDFDYTNRTSGVAHKTQVLIEEQELTQEFRIASESSGPLSYMGGLYYRKRDNQTDFYIDAVPSNGALSVYNDIPIREEEFGVFVHAGYQINDRLGVQSGLRWQKNNVFNRLDTYSSTGFPVSDVLLSSSISDDNEERVSREVTGSLKFTYDMTPDIMAYVSFEKSFRPGGVVITQYDLPEQRILFNDETSHAFEVGLKADLFESRLQMSAAAYYQEFQDLISFRRGIALDSSAPLDGVADASINGITDSADAVVRGVEIDAQGLLTHNWTVAVGVSYSDSYYKNGEDLLCTRFVGGVAVTNPGEPFATCDVGGRRISGEPLWSASLRSEYVHPFGPYDGFARGLYKFDGSRHDDDYGNVTGGHGVVNLYLGVRSQASAWEASVWLKNVFDKQGDARLPIPLLGTGFSWVEPIEERAFGASLTMSF